MPAPVVILIAPGVYQVDHDGIRHIVYVAGANGDRWAAADGRVYRDGPASDSPPRDGHRARGSARQTGPQTLTTPMPATVLKVLAGPGTAVKKGDTVILLEAMKMELPLRAPADATVVAVHCREGELVQPDVTLIELS